MEKIIELAPFFDRTGDDAFCVSIGRSTYEVVTHFNPQGKQSVLEQFKELLQSGALEAHT